MENPQIGRFKLTYRVKRIAAIVGLSGVVTIFTLPLLAQLYPPYYLFQPYAKPNYPYRDNKENLVNTIEKQNNLQNLADAIEQAGLTDTLKQEQFFTVLAPTDDAFNALPEETLDKLYEPENLKQVLQYHLIPGEMSQKQIESGAPLPTVQGNTITISNDNGNFKLNDATPKHPSTKATNGVIIEIDRVLLPPGF
jgi:uncharacterized surface protein with fasciclin (FAS1) repeats